MPCTAVGESLEIQEGVIRTLDAIDNMLLLLLLSLLLLDLDVLLAAPANREVYRMPHSALRALSDRGTVVLEAAMTSALSALERASSEKSRAEAGCRGCVPCLFQDCGQSLSCAPPGNALTEPSCEVISKAQKLTDEAERSWALSQACVFYQHRCQPLELDKESCIRIMGESCSARVLQCSLLNTMHNLEPTTHTRTQAVCGQRSSSVPNVTMPRSRIVGGSPATPGSWPWLVNLQHGGLMCGGVLVDSSWVVTAAHCFSGSRGESYWTAVVGEFDITKADPDEQVLKVNRIIPHPKFNPKTFNNDIALVELTAPVVISDHVTPVCLPGGSDPPTGSPCLVAGWGSLYEDGPSADVVMEAKVPLLPQSTCKSTLGKDLLTNTMLCAGYLSGGIDSCQGDSGGPLIYQDRMSGRFQLYGITSWGDGCGVKGKPGVYTRVSAFSDWIQSEIQKSFGSREPTCPELLKTTEMTEEEQRAEFSSLCRFYLLSCPPGVSTSTCSQSVQDKCLTRFKKCQLHSFLQTLLELLQRAEDYIREKVDLTFFTQTLPQLVEHIYNTAFAHTREKRDMTHGLGSIAELLGKVVESEDPEIPHYFRQMGPSVDDWQLYLQSLSDSQQSETTSGMQKQEKLLFLKKEAMLVHNLAGEYESVIYSLRSKLDSRSLPPVLNLGSSPLIEFADESPSSVSNTPESSIPSLHNQEPWSIVTAVIREIQKVKSQNLSETTKDMPPDLSRATSEEITFSEDHKSSPPSSTPISEMRHSKYQLNANTTGLQRKYRSLLRKRQTMTSSGKVCPAVRESSQKVIQVRDLYQWVLNIPNKNLQMSFHEVLVDLSSKNERGLYEARVKAVVGGRPVTFYSLVGLDSESFYRSVPRIISVALEGLKT
uniref:Peptidase S1 domain-containing protein n=1 Tax=Knipowitschia caucasica TaxID=637954 RepID=A0AAV2JSN2_KNICA